jgi:cell division protein ZapA (FtsZ GTPase activity inhibitor)
MKKTKIKVMGIEMDNVSEYAAEDINKKYEEIGKRFPSHDPEKLKMLVLCEFVEETHKLKATVSYLEAEVKEWVRRVKIAEERLAEAEDEKFN